MVWEMGYKLVLDGRKRTWKSQVEGEEVFCLISTVITLFARKYINRKLNLIATEDEIDPPEIVLISEIRVPLTQSPLDP